MAKYVTQEGIQLIINDYKNQLNVKADKAELENLATKEDLQNIDIPEINLENYATKLDVATAVAGIKSYDDTALTNRVSTLEGGLQGVYHFKGNKANLAELTNTVQNPENGDVYNLVDTGMNVAWNGEAWDDFGIPVDLSGYVLKSEVEELTKAEINALLYSGKTAVVNNATSLQAMVDNDQTEVQVNVIEDVVLTEKLDIPVGKKVVLKLEDGAGISSTARALQVEGELELQGGSVSAVEKPIAVYNGGKVTINGTDVTSTGNSGVSVYGPTSEVIVNSGSVEGAYGLTSFHGGTITINGGTIKSTDGAAISGNGSKYFNPTTNKFGSTAADGFVEQAPIHIIVNGGTFEGHSETEGELAAGIYWPGFGTLDINGGTIISDGAGIVQRGGTVNLNAGTTVVATGTSSILGKVGDSRVVVGPYAVVFDKNSQYPAYENMALNIAASGVSLNGTDGEIQILPEDAEGITDNRTIIGD